MTMDCFTNEIENTIPICVLTEAEYTTWLPQQETVVQTWLEQTEFTGKPQQYCLVPDSHGKLQQVVVGAGQAIDHLTLAPLATKLPASYNYRISTEYARAALQQLQLGWAMGSYRFSRYVARDTLPAKLYVSEDSVQHFARAIYLVRDLINTPAEHMDPEALEQTAKALAKTFGAKCQTVCGDKLNKQGFPAVYMVGRAADVTPRLIDLQWGKETDKKITLVGKGVCFDSGGLDLKPSSNMRLMKKDMGGAAHVLGLAQLIMVMKLPVRLRVIVPAVENAVAGNAYRPGDVISTRKGLSVEIGNTDAEGRLILADALTLASEDNPDLLISFATLTGAARVALGTDVPVMFSTDASLASQLQQTSDEVNDLVWQLPLHQPYKKLLKSHIADLNNISSSPFGGAITAALFLEHFISAEDTWIHYDLMAWNSTNSPGRPVGGEAMGLRATYEFIRSMLVSTDPA